MSENPIEHELIRTTVQTLLAEDSDHSFAHQFEKAVKAARADLVLMRYDDTSEKAAVEEMMRQAAARVARNKNLSPKDVFLDVVARYERVSDTSPLLELPHKRALPPGPGTIPSHSRRLHRPMNRG